MENTADIAHFGYLHGARNHRYLRDWHGDGPLAATRIGFSASGAALGAPVDWIDLEIEFQLYGLGYLVIDSHVEEAHVDGRIRVCATPIEGDQVRVFFMSNVARMPDPGFTDMVDQLFHEAALADFKQDLKIWQHKIYRPRPVRRPRRRADPRVPSLGQPVLRTSRRLTRGADRHLARALLIVSSMTET